MVLNKKVGSQVQFESRRDNEIEESVLPMAIKILSATHATLFKSKGICHYLICGRQGQGRGDAETSCRDASDKLAKESMQNLKAGKRGTEGNEGTTPNKRSLSKMENFGVSRRSFNHCC
jgi:hypothetical protein